MIDANDDDAMMPTAVVGCAVCYRLDKVQSKCDIAQSGCEGGRDWDL